MRKIILSLLAFPLLTWGQWEGNQVKIPKDAIGCISIGQTEEMYWFGKAGNKAAQDAYISQNKCIKFPGEMFATVVKDASIFTDPKQAQIMLILESGETIKLWVLMDEVKCCYRPN